MSGFIDESICNFIPYKNDYNSLHSINFVLERKNIHYKGITAFSTYKIHYVLKGTGVLHFADKKINLSAGDVFITFPGVPYGIEQQNDLEYMYITFIGIRATIILEKLGINKYNCFFKNCADLLSYWENGIDIKEEISDLIIDSILLYTFYYLGKKLLVSDNISNKSNHLALKIKKYIDDNYSDSNLSLDLISKNLSYTPKYISTNFKSTFKISASNYITTLRIQHACTLMNNGYTSISDIADQCGFNDAQYFSKVFKKILAITPKEYIKNVNNNY